jgi:signal peptidase I
MTWLPPPPTTSAPPRASRLRRFGAVIAVCAGVALVCLFVAAQVVRPVARIEGHAMEPFLQDDDRTLFFPVTGPIARGTVVTLRYPRNPRKLFVMRVVGLPDERLTIAKGVVHIGDVPLSEPYVAEEHRWSGDFGPVQLGPDEYFVMGDNRGNSSDSREWGPVARRFIRGTFFAVWWRRH